MEVDWLFVAERTLYLVVVWPAAISWWRSVWDALGLTTGLSLVHALAAILVADVGLAALKPKPGHPLAGRLLAYLSALIGVTRWKLVWLAADILIGRTSVIANGIALISSFLLAVILRVFSNTVTLAPIPDSSDVVYHYSPYFRTKEDSSSLVWILDVLFSVVFIGTLVVFVWRGSWTLLDIYLIPEDEEKSALVSMGIGYLLVVITFATQPLIKAAVRRTMGLWRLCVVDIYLLFSFCGTINVWRGIWLSLNYHLLPDDKELGFLISHIGCFVLLVLLNASNSIMVRGVYIDAEEPGDQCVDLPCYYLRLIFQEKRKKKLLKKQAAKIEEAANPLMEETKKIEIVRSIPEPTNIQGSVSDHKNLADA